MSHYLLKVNRALVVPAVGAASLLFCTVGFAGQLGSGKVSAAIGQLGSGKATAAIGQLGSGKVSAAIGQLGSGKSSAAIGQLGSGKVVATKEVCEATLSIVGGC